MKLYFKFKIALLSLLISGALLTIFGIILFGFIYQSGMDRMDREMRTLAEPLVHGRHPPEHWQQLENSLAFIYGSNATARVELSIVDRNNQLIFVSKNAPTALLKSLPSTAAPNTPKRRPPPSSFERPPPWDHPKDPHQIDPPTFSTLKNTTTGNWRVGTFSNPHQTITLAINMESFYAEINQFRTTFLIATPLSLLLLALAGWFLAARAMKPVAQMANTAESITAQELEKRIPSVANDIELERLVTVFNDMLERLEKSYQQAIRFSADAAHELQTPLTILQGELDNAIQSSEDGSNEQQRYSILLEELSNLKAVVQKLLLLAHADEGRLNLNPVPLNLSELIHEAVEDFEIIAPNLDVKTNLPSTAPVKGDPALLNQILRNMISNAAKYSTAEGEAVFTLKQTKSTISFTLANTAPPIPESDIPLLFERFHRVEKSRTTSGSGLGLSLAREIAQAHGGTLTLDPYANGMISFSLSLPREDEVLTSKILRSEAEHKTTKKAKPFTKV